jgi:branched-chain amino acid aminotransferase
VLGNGGIIDRLAVLVNGNSRGPFFCQAWIIDSIAWSGYVRRSAAGRRNQHELNDNNQTEKTMGIYFVDGDYVDETAAVLPVTDLIILRGYGVFDFLRTYNGYPFHLPAHAERLRNSAALIGMDCPWSLEELSSIVHTTLEKNGYKESNIRMLITGGDSEDNISPGRHPRLLVMVNPLKSFPEIWYRDGIKIITARLNRFIPGAKSIDYIRAIMTLRDAHAAGAVESVYVSQDDRVLEGTTSNLFIVSGGSVITPSDDILPGITREVVLDLLEPEFKPEVRPVTMQELTDADEVFMSSSTKELVPVVQVDDCSIGDRRPGPVSRRIMGIFREYTANYGG